MTKIIALTLLILTFCAISARAQTAFSDKIIIDLSSGGAISFQPKMSVLVNGKSLPFLDLSNLKHQTVIIENGLQRILYDETNNVIFGYEARIEPKKLNGDFQLSFQPLTENVAQTLRNRFFPKSLTNKKPFRLLTLQPSNVLNINDGETFELDLLVNSQMNVKISDRLRVAANRSELESNPPQDFTLNAIELAAIDSKIIVDNQLYKTRYASRRSQSSLLWFHLPDKGLFVASLTPREGYDFRRIGVLDNDKISFDVDGEKYSWTSGEPFFATEGVWNIWILHVPNYEPPVVALSKPLDEIASKRSFTSRIVDNLNVVGKILRLDFNFMRVQPKVTFAPNLNLAMPENKQTRAFVGGAKSLEELLPPEKSNKGRQ
ncbi:MAG: hypothetical protein H7Z37_09705 [Pyrinomonadaceae bacterium]|nr:hypothetical protein [Pyrinomonadaceae bacterium]